MAMRALTKNNHRKTKFGFTLIEIIIAMTLFSIIAALGTTFFVQISRIYKRVTLQNELLNETEFAMERIRQIIGQNTIDYEEYYSRNVIGDSLYGQNYGEYGETFYDAGGYATGEGPDALLDYDAQKELYLINGTGDHKIIFGSEITGEDADGNNLYAIAMTEMDGTDGDLDGIPETWTCSSDYTCNATGPTPDQDDFDDNTNPNNEDFIPITPSNITITRLEFYIAPLKDPRKAFAEKDEEVVVQPRVTIVLEAEITADAALGTYGLPPSIQLETTVSSHVYNEVTSYVSN